MQDPDSRRDPQARAREREQNLMERFQQAAVLYAAARRAEEDQEAEHVARERRRCFRLIRGGLGGALVGAIGSGVRNLFDGKSAAALVLTAAVGGGVAVGYAVIESEMVPRRPGIAIERDAPAGGDDNPNRVPLPDESTPPESSPESLLDSPPESGSPVAPPASGSPAAPGGVSGGGAPDSPVPLPQPSGGAPGEGGGGGADALPPNAGPPEQAGQAGQAGQGQARGTGGPGVGLAPPPPPLGVRVPRVCVRRAFAGRIACVRMPPITRK